MSVNLWLKVGVLKKNFEVGEFNIVYESDELKNSLNINEDDISAY